MTIADMDIPGFRLHSLKGEMRGRWSVMVSGNWRLTFEFRDGNAYRSEEHTSELQSLMRISYAVFCLKKKKVRTDRHRRTTANKQTTEVTNDRKRTRDDA